MQRLSIWFGVILFLVFGCRSPYQQTSEYYSPIIDKNNEVITDTVKTKPYPFQEVSQSVNQLLKTNSTYSKELISVYQINNYKPLWWSTELKIIGINLIQKSYYHGLDPTYYGIDEIMALYKLLNSDTVFVNEKNAAFDINLTQGLIKFIGHLQNGKLNPTNYRPASIVKPNKAFNDSLFVKLIASGYVSKLDSVFQPKIMHYSQLVYELRQYYSVEDTKHEILKYPKKLYRPGDSNNYILLLKKSLVQKGYLNQDSLTMVFDKDMEAALKKFQLKHGLTPDGLPGKQTFKFLNWQKQNYINALKVNLERLRWLPEDLPENFISVNIPEYKMRLFLEGKTQMENRVIVGKYKNQTPLLTSYINYLVFNPCWTVPNSITVKSILPRIKKDSTYLDRRNMFLGKNGVEINSKDIDFSIYSKDNFPYKVYQRTGSGNALGKVKFMFDNNYSIYLHDTPSQSLFAKDYRALSHGCIRVQHAMKLAETILYTHDNHSRKINYYLQKGYPEKVFLKNEIPLMIHYFTCGYDEELQQVLFFSDVYAKDLKVIVALD